MQEVRRNTDPSHNNNTFKDNAPENSKLAARRKMPLRFFAVTRFASPSRECESLPFSFATSFACANDYQPRCAACPAAIMYSGIDVLYGSLY